MRIDSVCGALHQIYFVYFKKKYDLLYPFLLNYDPKPVSILIIE